MIPGLDKVSAVAIHLVCQIPSRYESEEILALASIAALLTQKNTLTFLVMKCLISLGGLCYHLYKKSYPYILPLAAKTGV